MVQTCRLEPGDLQTLVHTAHIGRSNAIWKLFLKINKHIEEAHEN